MKAALAFFLLLPALPLQAAPTFTAESGVRVATAVPQAITGSYPAMRLYFIRNSTQVLSATTADGLAFTEEAGTRLSTGTVPSVDAATITACAILPLNAGGFRMLYSAVGVAGAFNIFSATSADGLGWANEAGARVTVDAGTTFVGSPKLTKLSSGDWRLYYVRDSNGGNQAADHQIFSALSNDQGATWGASAVVVAAKASEVAASTSPLSEGLVRLYYSSTTVVLSALSSNGNASAFSVESGIRFSSDTVPGTLSHPLVVRSTDSYSLRLYYAYTAPGASTSTLLSALANAPAPRTSTPSTADKGSGPASINVIGDVFSPAASLKLVRAGQTDIAGTVLTRANDQSLTATFDIDDKALGYWDMLVTNANGTTGTLSNALFIDFAEGQVNLTDNLLRPRQGTSTRIDIQIFTAGRTTVKLYTLNGEFINTLLDATLPEGKSTLFWNGRSAGGAVVASGVYLLEVRGPKLNAVKKIVVIK